MDRIIKYDKRKCRKTKEIQLYMILTLILRLYEKRKAKVKLSHHL